MVALGDVVERVLRFFGITKTLVQSVVGECGCNKRQSALNQWGYRWQYKMLVPFYWVLQQLHRVRHSTLAMRLWLAWYHLRMAVRSLIYGG
jgi:hypothetical protein